jgi:2-polyprenyl-6-methoxyphenol hydroxylase-like FAD-dependent oxidoreductase
LLNTFSNFQEVSAQRLFDAFARMLPPEWGIGEDTAEGRVLSGPLPMGFNRMPAAVPGLLLVGDAVGAVNPFNGEGIAYAIETGEIAADLLLLCERPGVLEMSLPSKLTSYVTSGRPLLAAVEPGGITATYVADHGIAIAEWARPDAGHESQFANFCSKGLHP